MGDGNNFFVCIDENRNTVAELHIKNETFRKIG